MNLKRILLLASMALAAMAFGAPAAQASLDWDGDGLIKGTGNLTSHTTTGITTGPGLVHFEAAVAKGSTTATITKFEITGTLPVTPPSLGCHAKADASALPWTGHLTTPDTLTITNVTFTNTYTPSGPEPCLLPTAVPVDGNVTLTVEEDPSTGENRCANATPYQDFATLGVEPNTSPGVDITGTVCWSGPAITGL